MPVDESFLDRLAELKTQHIEHIVNGGVESFDDYRHLCGVLRGIGIAEREYKELLTQVDA